MDPIKASIWYLPQFHFSEEICASVRLFPVILFFAEYLHIYGLIYRLPSSYIATLLYRDANPIHLSLQSCIIFLHWQNSTTKKIRPDIATWTCSRVTAAHHTDKVFLIKRNGKGSDIR